MNKNKETQEVTTAAASLQKTSGVGDAQPVRPPVFVEAEKLFERMAELTTQIGQRAFDFFRQRGGEFGRELDDWFKAENEVLRPVPVKITEANNDILVTAAVPGFKPEDIEISVNGDTLILSGKTEVEEKNEDANIVINEWKSDQFFRQFTLPSPVDAEKVVAKLKDGILELTLPKTAGNEAKKIAIAAG